MLKTIFIIIVLYCLLSGKYKDYINVKTPIPLISKFGKNGKDIKVKNNNNFILKIGDTSTGVSLPYFIQPGETIDYTLSAKGDIIIKNESGQIYKTITGKDIKNGSIITI